MTTSGSANFSVNRNQIIQEAFEMGGVVRAGAALSGANLAKGSFVLNAMVKQWMASGIHIWTVAEAVMIPASSQTEYSLGTTSTDHVTLESDYVETELASDAASGATALTVDSITGIAASDKLGIQLDDGTIQWTTVSGAPSGTTVTAAVALTDTAGSGAKVFAFTNNLVRPLKIVGMRRKNLSSGNFTPLARIERLDYRSLSNPTAEGAPVGYFYDPQLTLGKLHLYQSEAAPTEIIYFTHHRPLEDFDTAADNPDLPQEWIKALNLGLALDLGLSFDIPEQRYGRIKEQFAYVMSSMEGFDREEGSVFFQPDMRR